MPGVEHKLSKMDAAALQVASASLDIASSTVVNRQLLEERKVSLCRIGELIPKCDTMGDCC